MRQTTTIQSKETLLQAAPTAVSYYLTFSTRRTVIAFSLPLLIYLLTLAPTVYNLDSAELTTAAATEGIMRATGYPLYIVLGHLWVQLPFGDVGYRLNFFSAFHGAFTIALTERILQRWRVDRGRHSGRLGCWPARSIHCITITLPVASHRPSERYSDVVVFPRSIWQLIHVYSERS
ncbi:MAG: DUF2723 domain-containing protein [Chloroflexales bacterium]|nr:DUF2723 domain-containing protein [Chloroflexales bacterium]